MREIQYLVITSVRTEEDKEKYFRLAQYLKSLNSKFEVYFIATADENEFWHHYTYKVDFDMPACEAIKLCEFTRASLPQISDICCRFISDNFKNDDYAFILFNGFLLTVDGKTDFKTFRREEIAYYLYDNLRYFLCDGKGNKYYNLVDFAFFTNDCIGLNFMSRALIRNRNAKTLNKWQYSERNLWWFKHSDNGTMGSLNFSDELVNSIKEYKKY